MKRTSFLIFVLAFLTFSIYAKGPANKATGSILRGVDTPNFIVEFTAHESVAMKNGKTRPAKGMVTAYHLTNSDSYWAVDVECVNVISETDAVFAGSIVLSGSRWSQFVGDYMKFWVYDGGEPGAFTDKIYTEKIPDDPDETEMAMEFCENPYHLNKDWNVFEGNIQVHYRDID